MKTNSLSLFILLLATALFSLAGRAQADTFGVTGTQFTINFVPIGNAGNANDTTGYGGVSYNYNMAVTDVSQTMLADAAALSGTNLGGGAWSGSQPAADVSWYQAAAFVNWLNTSQGYTAAYDLTYAGNTPTGITLWTAGSEWTLGGTDYFRNANAHYFVPSENEWSKAAYYSPGGVYYQYADGSNTPPTAVLSGTAAGTAVYTGTGVSPSAPAAVDQSGGLSPYGTQGQTGNVWQWAETDYSDPTNSSDSARVIRGGGWNDGSGALASSFRNGGGPSATFNGFGFRVASVPEPNSIMLMVAGALGLALMRGKPFKL